MNKTLCTLSLLFVWAVAEEKRVPDAVLKADSRCNYIIQGASPAQARVMGQMSVCIDWHSYATRARHLAAMKLYREEIWKAFPNPSQEMLRDLAEIYGGK